MKLPKKVAAFSALAALAAPLTGLAPASATPTKLAVGAKAIVLDGVTVGAGGTTASFAAMYSCPAGAGWHLWVSVKQAADGRPDNALKGEGSGFGGVGATWLQSHPDTGITCDGGWHTGTFTVNQTEGVGYGTLIPGQAYVQFCLTSLDDTWIAFDMQYRSVR